MHVGRTRIPVVDLIPTPLDACCFARAQVGGEKPRRQEKGQDVAEEDTVQLFRSEDFIDSVSASMYSRHNDSLFRWAPRWRVSGMIRTVRMVLPESDAPISSPAETRACADC